MIADNLMDEEFIVSEELRGEVINYALKLLVKENYGKLDLGKRKKAVLANIAKSLIITFPCLKTTIRPGESQDWEYVSM